MADITNQHLYDKLTQYVDKRFDLIDKRFDRMDRRLDLMDRKIDEHMSINTKHHLETRRLIAEVNRKFDHLRDGLAQAIAPV